MIIYKIIFGQKSFVKAFEKNKKGSTPIFSLCTVLWRILKSAPTTLYYANILPNTFLILIVLILDFSNK